MIKTLNEKFVNTWVFERELPELISGAKGEVVSRIAKNLEEHHRDSVNIFALTSHAEVILHQRETELPDDDEKQAYLSLLRRALIKN
ncbi:MAG: hypothetical protein OXN17_01870 [Candidatus Poribacteria bacterium]|nr:hypothetical protein [Candidatus Poribacteria bacterium]MDE0506391.1 hypothetical protein [Candidatus Poribacteria bacterium]